MKKIRTFVLALVCILALLSCSRKPSGDPLSETSDRRAMILVEETWYLNTGKAMPAEIDPSAIIGEITSSVDQSQVPTEDGQSNFDCIGSQYAYCEGGLTVMINNEWYFFEPEEPCDNSRRRTTNASGNLEAAYLSCPPLQLPRKESACYNKNVFTAVRFSRYNPNRYIERIK